MIYFAPLTPQHCEKQDNIISKLYAPLNFLKRKANDCKCNLFEKILSLQLNREIQNAQTAATDLHKKKRPAYAGLFQELIFKNNG